MDTANSLRDRVRDLIDTHHDGNVNKAAALIGVTQSTLNRIYSGDEERKPRLEVIEQIANFYKTTPEWLLYGRGEGPVPLPQAIPPVAAARAMYLHYANLLDKLPIQPETRSALESMMFATAPLDLGGSDSERERKAAKLATQEFLAKQIITAADRWGALLTEFGLLVGAVPLGRALDEGLGILSLHNLGFLRWLQERGVIPQDLAPLYREYVQKVEAPQLRRTEETLAHAVQVENGTAGAKPEASPPPNKRPATKKRKKR